MDIFWNCTICFTYLTNNLILKLNFTDHVYNVDQLAQELLFFVSDIFRYF